MRFWVRLCVFSLLFLLVILDFNGTTITFLVLYVDDILHITNDVGILSSNKVRLSKNFYMIDL